MTVEEKIQRIKNWQNAGYVHPLTCRKDSQHADLEPVEVHGEVALSCPTCGYIQLLIEIPPVVFSGYIDNVGFFIGS